MKNKFYLLQFLILILSVFLSLRFGATSEFNAEVFYQFRLPRTLLAFSIGGLLALSGLILQLLFFNPLCEPYTLGLASGGTLAVIVAQFFSLPLSIYGFSPWAVLGTAFFGSILLLLSKKPGVSQSELLITGVMLSFLGSSLVTLWMLLQDPTQIQNTLAYLFGDLSRAETIPALILLGVGVLSVIYLYGIRREMDALLLGEDLARSSGIDVRKVRRHLLILVTLLIAFSVSAAGMIGFVGLMVPFFVRRGVGALHRYSVPFSFLWGGGLLLVADFISRTIVRPYEIPVGVVTSLLGAPFFLWAYRRRHGKGIG
jgi:ABC-type Fe3+-siderophore transport system permease subunit